MVTAFDVLFRYTVNMLKLKRPRNWHTIKFSNAQFKARADCMVGTRDILKLMGYTKPILAEDGSQSGLSYPDPTQINHDAIKIIGAELLTAKLEVKAAQEQGGFRHPLPMDGVQLDNPQLIRHPQLEPDYYSSIQQQPVHLQPTPTASPMGSSESYRNYDSIQMSYSSQYGNPQTLTQHSSYQPPSSGYQPSSNSYQPSSNSYQPSSRSYGQPSVRPHGQQFDYQARNQYGYQSNFQSTNQSSESTTNFETHISSPSSSQPSSTELQSSTGGVSGRLAELRRRKEQIIQQAFGRDPQSSGDSHLISSIPTTAQAPYTHPPPTMQPSHASPSTTAEMQPSNPLPPSAASSQPNKPPPVKRRTKFLAVAPSNDEVKYPPSLPEETVPSVIREEPPPPVQQPQARKATFPRSRGPRTMVECDQCFFPNHEKSQQCVECDNPRTERWRKIQMPSSANNTDEQNVVPVDNQPFPQEREAYNPHHEAATLSNTQSSNTQPNSVGSGQLKASNGAAAGASGTSSQPLRAYIPVVNYTAEEKEEMKKKAERERMRALQQEQGMNGGGAETVPLNSYVPRNDNYNWDEGKAGVRSTGNALFNSPNSTEPEDAQMYKSLGTQGHVLIQDIKVHVYTMMAVHSVYNGIVLVLRSAACTCDWTLIVCIDFRKG